MPGRPHHTDKMKRCVEEVQAKGHSESSAYAICTTSMQNAGEAVYAQDAEALAILGEGAGHDFHGNQYSGGSGGKDSITQTSAKTKKERLNDTFNAHAHEMARYGVEAENFGAGVTDTGIFSSTNAGGLETTVDHKTGKITHDWHNPEYLPDIITPKKSTATDRLDRQSALAKQFGKHMKYRSERKQRNSEESEDVGFRELHLLGATGQVRYETLNGRKHLVVPVVALMEGVIHPVNAETPEFVSADVLRRAAASWIGKPVTLGHPKRNGKQCSASDASVRKDAGIGVIMKSDFNGKKMLQEAWIDEEKAKQLHPKMYETLAAGGREEVSVGAFAVTTPKEADFNSKRYKAAWVEAQGDHLAFLPGGRGACSCDMGCGTHRAAQMHLVTAESIEAVPDELPTLMFTTLQGDSLEERMQAVNYAVQKKWPTSGSSVIPNDYPYVLQTFDDRVIVRKGDETYSIDYTTDTDGTVTLGAITKVEQQWVAAAKKTCEMCGGTGQVKDGSKQMDCPSCDGNGYLKTAAGARHSSGDMKMIQNVHDHAVALGAVCDRKNLETAAAVITPPSPQPDRVKREGTKWALYSAVDAKRVLAYHNTEAEAKEHEQRLLAQCG